MFTRIKHLLELIRFSHTIFALPFALLAALMAAFLHANSISRSALDSNSVFVHDTYLIVGGKTFSIPDWIGRWFFFTPRTLGDIYAPPPLWGKLCVGIILCMIFARSAAMAFNRIVDWKIDARNARTERRHLPAGLLSLGTVVVFWLICCVAFVASTLLFLPNKMPLILSVPVLLFLCGYSYTKRFTAMAHFWLGAALMLAPICAWIAIRGEAVMANPGDILPAVILGGAVMLWVAGFDIIYACQDVEFDKQAGLHSVPAKLGVANALRLAALCHAGMIVLLAALPWFYPLFGWVYWTGIAAVALLLIYEHWLVRPDDLTRVNTAFFNVNAVVSIGLLAVGALDLLT
jgi:4-hydroxybenzoate polyprenyltransferase